MSSAQNLWTPASTASTTLTVNLFSRPTEGSGTFASRDPLVIVFANGRHDGLSVSVLHDLIVSHVLNTTLVSDYSPRIGTLEQAVRSALEASLPLPSISTATTLYLKLWFDGEFGSVYASV